MKLKLSSRLREAFSIVEVLIGMAVAGIVFVSLYAGISAAFGVLQMTRENLRATQIMVEKMETIRLYNWQQLNETGFIPQTFTAPYHPLGDGDGGLLFSGKLVITNAPFNHTYAEDVRLIRVELNWTSGRVERKREMSTLVTRNGLQNYIY
jgi:type II secretory pathway pseudopilin PulG